MHDQSGLPVKRVLLPGTQIVEKDIKLDTGQLKQFDSSDDNDPDSKLPRITEEAL